MPLSRRAFLSGAAVLGGAAALGVSASGREVAASEAWDPAPKPLPEGFARGMNLAHQHVRGRGYGSEVAAAQLDTLRGLGVRDVALNPFAYTPSLGSPEIRWGGDPTLTDDDLRRQIEQANTRGMRVLMKPHLWSGSFWTGAGNPDIAMDRDAWSRWFDGWTAYVLHHAALAEETGCRSLCIGLEFTKATEANPGAWAEVARACRGVFKGRLCYGANWYEEYSRFADWDALDCVGIHAYFPLAGRTVEELEKAWDGHFDTIGRAVKGRPVVFTEAGYQAVAGATDRPWEQASGAADPEIQARAYEALLRAGARRPWFEGVYWWKWFTADGPDRDRFVPETRAQDVMRAWFAQA